MYNYLTMFHAVCIQNLPSSVPALILASPEVASFPNTVIVSPSCTRDKPINSTHNKNIFKHIMAVCI